MSISRFAGLSLRFSRILPLIAAATTAASALPVQARMHTFHTPRVIGTSLDVAVVSHDAAAADHAFVAIHAEIARLEAMLSTRIPTSFISAINTTHDPVAVPAEVIELLTAYTHAATLTDGICSPLTGELTARWWQAAKQNTLPSTGELSVLAARISQSSLKIDAALGTVQRIGDATLNIDALGKPFILAKATDAAWKNVQNLQGLLVNIGGDIAVRGTPGSSATSWTVDVTDPANPADNAPALTSVAMTKSSIVTSGDAARGRTIAGTFVSHILDPRTGLPAGHGIAATVMHHDPVIANALATSFCVAGPEVSRDLAARADADFILAGNGPVLISEGTTAGAAASQPATAPAAWPKGFDATIDFNILPSSAPRDRRAVALAWIKDATGKHVKTLAVWGNVNDKDNRRPLAVWVNLGIKNFKTATSRVAGNYTVTWDGTDQDNKPVTQGKYTVHMEVTWEHGGHSVDDTIIDCQGDKAVTKIKPSKGVAAGDITYGPPEKPAPAGG